MFEKNKNVIECVLKKVQSNMNVFTYSNCQTGALITPADQYWILGEFIYATKTTDLVMKSLKFIRGLMHICLGGI